MSKSGETCYAIAPGEVEATVSWEKENETALVEDGGPPRWTRLSHQREPQRQPTQLSSGHRGAWWTFHVVHRSSHAEKTSLHCTNDTETEALYWTQREPGTYIWTEGLFTFSSRNTIVTNRIWIPCSILSILSPGYIQRDICADSQQSIHDLRKVQGESSDVISWWTFKKKKFRQKKMNWRVSKNLFIDREIS